MDEEDMDNLTEEELSEYYLELEEQREEADMERRSQCKCGAFVWSKSAYNFIQVADCVCGEAY